MSKLWIVFGDKTDHGGVVITAAPETDVNGKKVARLGDMVSCPKCKGVFPIAQGDATIIIDGKPVALHGHKTACGATLIAGQQGQVFVDNGGGGSSPGAGSKASATGEAAIAATGKFDEAFILLSELTGKPLKNRRYKVTRVNGSTEAGTTDDEGRTHVVKTNTAERLTVELEEEVPA